MTDKQWQELMKDAPRQAFARLMDEYGGLIYAIVLNKLNTAATKEEIEDCVSDVFVEIFRSISGFSEKHGSMKSFVSSIAKFTAIDAYRRISVRRRFTSSLDEQETELPDDAPDPEQSAHDKLLKKRLWELVREQGMPDSAILTYQYFYGLTLHQTAQKLGLSYENTKKRSLRARQRIKKILEKEELI